MYDLHRPYGYLPALLDQQLDYISEPAYRNRVYPPVYR
jgi:hypothetical protein